MVRTSDAESPVISVVEIGYVRRSEVVHYSVGQVTTTWSLDAIGPFPLSVLAPFGPRVTGLLAAPCQACGEPSHLAQPRQGVARPPVAGA